MQQERTPATDAALPYRLDWSRRGSLREVLREHAVVHLEAPRLSAKELLALACELGTVHPERRPKYQHADIPEIMNIGNLRNAAGAKIGASALSFGFHSDRSFERQPPDITLLYALETPTRGGDTEFSSLYRLYDACDAETREAWASLEVEHEAASRELDGQPDRCSVHPLLRVHPDTGRHLVFASPPYAKKVIGVSAAEGETILQHIADSLTTPDFVHRWRPNDLLLWDNRAVAHRATEFDTSEARHLWRIALHLNAPARADSPDAPDSLHGHAVQ